MKQKHCDAPTEGRYCSPSGDWRNPPTLLHAKTKKIAKQDEANACSHTEGCMPPLRSKRESQRNSKVLRPTKPLAAMITAPHRRSKPLKASLPEPLGQRQSDLKIRHILVALAP
eukprot:g59994.t1